MTDEANAFRPCECGEKRVHVDSWENWKTRKIEFFGRCQKCGKTGESAETPAEAVEKWNR